MPTRFEMIKITFSAWRNAMTIAYAAVRNKEIKVETNNDGDVTITTTS